jgi:single-strand DNA-binding protein
MEMSINRVVISGNLTRDPELSSTAGGMAILRMGIAVNDRRKNQQTGEWEEVPNFFDVKVFGTRAEGLSRFLSKGSKIAVEGKLNWSSWEDKNTGDKRSKVEIIADNIEFMSAKGEGSGGGGYSAPSSTPPSKPDTFEDDIPF